MKGKILSTAVAVFRDERVKETARGRWVLLSQVTLVSKEVGATQRVTERLERVIHGTRGLTIQHRKIILVATLHC